jgi:carboxymethylenebutenolidase
MTRTETLPTPDGPMPAFLAEPEGASRGGIVVVQEAFGVTPHIESICTRLADAGFTAIAPALFHREGSPSFAYDIDFAELMPLLSTLNAVGLTVDLNAAFGYLEHEGFSGARVGVVGFCMGGTVSFFAATLRPLGAAVTFYGGGIAQGRFGLPPQLENASKLQTPWLGLYGDQDTGIPSDDVEQLRAVTDALPVDTAIVRYPHAEHGFNCDDRASYHEVSAKDAWARTLEWFGAHLAE